MGTNKKQKSCVRTDTIIYITHTYITIICCVYICCFIQVDNINIFELLTLFTFVYTFLENSISPVIEFNFFRLYSLSH